MSDTKQYSLSQHNMAAPATIDAYDDVNDWFVPLGYLDNIRLRRETDNVFQSEIHVGRSVAIDAYTVAERWFVNFDMMERLNPSWQRLIFKNCGTPAIFGSCSLLTVTEERRMFRNNAQILQRNNGFYGDGALPAPTNAVGADAGGGAFPAGTYTFVIEAVYTDSQGLNPTRSVYLESNALVVGASLVTLTWDAPAGGYVPAYYNIYEYNTAAAETRVDADLIAVVDGLSPTAIIFAALNDIGDYPGDAVGGAFAVTDITGLINYTAGDDYTIDTTCARFALLDDGDINDGELILITYTYIANPFYTQSIGPGSRNPRILHLVIKWFKDDERAVPVGRGAEIHLYHVHSESGFEWLFDQRDFESGFGQEYRVLIDRATGKYGTIYTFHKVMENWDLIDLEAISKYTNDDACSVISS